METIAIFLVISIFVFFIAFLSGKKIGASGERVSWLDSEKKLQRELIAATSKKNEIQREIEGLRHKSEQYLHFLVRLPEAVKRLNSNISFDEIVSSIIRLTRDLVETDAIELYILNRQKNSLDLIAAFG